jgi:hypothetical protein
MNNLMSLTQGVRQKKIATYTDLTIGVYKTPRKLSLKTLLACLYFLAPKTRMLF